MLRRWLTAAPDSLASSFGRHRSGAKGRWVLAFNLMWLFWVFGDLIFQQRFGPGWLPATVVSLPVFLLLYALANLRPMRELLRYGLAMALLGYLTLPFNQSGGTCYVIYACAYLAFQDNPWRVARLVACVVLVFVLETVFQHWPWQVAVMMTMICTAAAGGNLSIWLGFRKNAELRLSHDEVRRLAATAERERIGRDLHDLLGHTLSLVALKSELAGRLIERDRAAARREIAEVERVARDALVQVRSAVTGIRATDLAAELASARLLLESASVHFDYRREACAWPPEIETTLALVLREAATNILRHAHAGRARVALQREGNAALLRIEDDGRGGVAAHGNGLCGMRERVEALGGSLKIDSPRGRGTAIEARLPLPALQVDGAAPVSTNVPAASVEQLAGGRA